MSEMTVIGCFIQAGDETRRIPDFLVDDGVVTLLAPEDAALLSETMAWTEGRDR